MVNGISQVKAMFRRKGQAVVAAAKAAARDGGEDVAVSMRFLAPKDDGELIASIKVRDADTIATRKGQRDFIGVIVSAGDSSTVVTNSTGKRFQNAKIQEFGRQGAGGAANPYFFPAWRLTRRKVRSGISRAIRKAWISG